jgi:hypothetical protein
MTEWAFLLTPLLVLPIVLLFRFVGCGTLLTISEDTNVGPPRYRDYIMGEPNNPGTVKNSNVVPNKADVIGYWRLVDAPTSKVAKDEKGFQDGSYTETQQSLPDQAPTPTTAGSESASGSFFPNHYSLIDSDVPAMCRIFDGGFVLVPFKSGLYTDEFTIECWIEATWTKGAGYEHTLFNAGGFYRIPYTSSTDSTCQGFRIFADHDNHWQMNIFSRPGVVFTSPPLIPRNGKTHLAIVVQKDPANVSNRTVTLYSDGKPVAIETVGYYALPDQAPLLIGVGDAAQPLAANSPQPYQPVLSPIQEVVLYRKGLSADEIANHVDINRK